jgi:hypothetical protein
MSARSRRAKYFYGIYLASECNCEKHDFVLLSCIDGKGMMYGRRCSPVKYLLEKFQAKIDKRHTSRRRDEGSSTQEYINTKSNRLKGTWNVRKSSNFSHFARSVVRQTRERIDMQKYNIALLLHQSLKCFVRALHDARDLLRTFVSSSFLHLWNTFL